MWKQFTSQDSYKWVEILSNSVKSYNNSFHCTIGMKPNEVNHENFEKLRKFYNANSPISNKTNVTNVTACENNCLPSKINKVILLQSDNCKG